jgi:flagellar basal-body rod protein FlgF
MLDALFLATFKNKGTGKMENAAYIALSRQGALRREMDVIANNIANMNTTAFKSESMMFVQHLVKSKSSQGLAPQKMAYVRDVAQYQNLNEGPIKQTGNSLDVALHGQGFFVVDTPDGELYTRNGRFNLNPEGQLVNQQNLPVLSDAGTPFFFSPDDKNISIGSDGTISTNNGDIGKLKIVKFDDPQTLQKRPGGLLFTEKRPTGDGNGGESGAQIVEKPTIMQGALEGSNVEPISEISKMIQVQRAYDGVKSFVNKEDERQRKMIQQLTPRI